MKSTLKGLWLRDRKTQALYRVTQTGEGLIHYRGESGRGRVSAHVILREFEIHTEIPLPLQGASCN